jgi:hypothetical protein
MRPPLTQDFTAGMALGPGGYGSFPQIRSYFCPICDPRPSVPPQPLEVLCVFLEDTLKPFGVEVLRWHIRVLGASTSAGLHLPPRGFGADFPRLSICEPTPMMAK